MKRWSLGGSSQWELKTAQICSLQLRSLRRSKYGPYTTEIQLYRTIPTYSPCSYKCLWTFLDGRRLPVEQVNLCRHNVATKASAGKHRARVALQTLHCSNVNTTSGTADCTLESVLDRGIFNTDVNGRRLGNDSCKHAALWLSRYFGST